MIYIHSPSSYACYICIAPPQMSGFAVNDAVVGEGVLSSRITQPKLGAEARFGDIYIFFW